MSERKPVPRKLPSKDPLADELACQLREKFPGILIEREASLHPKRRFRIDVTLPHSSVMIEINGGLWLKRGGHTSGPGIKRDMQKLALANLQGWRLYQVSPEQVKNGEALLLLEHVLGYKEGVPAFLLKPPGRRKRKRK